MKENYCNDHSACFVRLDRLEKEDNDQWKELSNVHKRVDSILTRLNYTLGGIVVAIIILLLQLVFTPIAKGETQTINTIPQADSSLITNLQNFLQDESPMRDESGIGNRIVSGGIGATSVSLSHTISAVTAYVEGYYIYDASISHTYTLSTATFVLVRVDTASTITIAGAAITYDGNFVFAEMALGSTPKLPGGVALLFEAITDATAITSVIDYRSGILYLSNSTFSDSSNGRLYDAVSTLGSLPCLLVIDIKDVMGDDVSVPSTMRLFFVPNCFIDTNGNSLTFASPKNILAGVFEGQNIFDSDASVSFTAGGTVFPTWWTGTTAEQLNAAWESLPSTGGIIDARSYNGSQTIDEKIGPITTDDLCFLFGSATFTLSGVTAQQSPFGAQILIQSRNVKFLGNNTTLKLDAGAQADIFSPHHGAHNITISGFELDGNKSNNTSIVDDTFQSGIQVISDSGSGATENAKVTIKDCVIHDFNHYGIVLYGDYSGDCVIENNLIYSNGKNDVNGTGDGIFLNLETSNNIVRGNKCYSNQRNGIHISSAGGAQVNNKILFNDLFSNTQSGLLAHEESTFGSLSGIGQDGLIVSGNCCYSNTLFGIRLVVADSLGYISNAIISNNVVYSNTSTGIVLNGANDATNSVFQTAIFGNQIINNGAYGISVSAYVLDTTIINNIIIGNSSGTISDSGTRTIDAWNKLNTANTTLTHDGGETITGTMTAGNFQVNGGAYNFDETGVRSWTIQADSGLLKILSGDGLGAVALAKIGVSGYSANTNTPSGATAYALAVYDGSGNLVGYVPVYAAQW